jgi:hypothetical protein
MPVKPAITGKKREPAQLKMQLTKVWPTANDYPLLFSMFFAFAPHTAEIADYVFENVNRLAERVGQYIDIVIRPIFKQLHP